MASLRKVPFDELSDGEKDAVARHYIPQLIQALPSHDEFILQDELKEIGIPFRTVLEIYELMQKILLAEGICENGRGYQIKLTAYGRSLQNKAPIIKKSVKSTNPWIWLSQHKSWGFWTLVFMVFIWFCPKPINCNGKKTEIDTSVNQEKKRQTQSPKTTDSTSHKKK